MQKATFIALIFAIGCNKTGAPAEMPAEPKKELAAAAPAPTPTPDPAAAAAPATDEKTAKLVTMHDGLWDMMKLSAPAKKELNAIVVSVNVQMQKNKDAHPEMFGKEPKRQKAPTHDEYIASHKKRFDKLGISEPTQKELLAGAEFVWAALQPDSKVSDAEKATAQKIKEMMTSMGGPPPCCDDNIFDKATAPVN